MLLVCSKYQHTPPNTHNACVSVCIWQEAYIEKLATRPPSSEAVLPAAALRRASSAEGARSYLLNINNYATDATACMQQLQLSVPTSHN